jgi:hypothetical protein
MPRHAYTNTKAISHAKQWCGQQSNSCGVYLQGGNKSDCAHFLAHCLDAGGITISDASGAAPLCPKGLAVRNVDLVGELNKLSAAFDNVKKIDLSDAIVGDVGFLKIERPRHAFMVCEVWNPIEHPLSTPKVYAHSTSRCCEEMDTIWRQWFTDAFRLEDG